MNDLGTVNLIVGTNNCGKTTVLEAIHIAAAYGSPVPVWSAPLRRGEELWFERELVGNSPTREFDVRRLFRGHELEIGVSFQLNADTKSGFLRMRRG